MSSPGLLVLALCAAAALASPKVDAVGYVPAAPGLVPAAPGIGFAAPGIITATANNDDTTTIGTCLTGDKLLHIETVRLSAKWLQVRHQNVEYPGSGDVGGLISCVQLVDLKGRNNGSAVIQKGGPGQREVVVRVKSDRGHSVAWNVLIYGR